MADEELAHGIDPASRALATQVKKTQQAEIDQMRAMLGQAERTTERGGRSRSPEPPPPRRKSCVSV